MSIKLVATSNRFGLDKYLFCRNCFSSSKSCWLVNAVRGLLVFPSNECGCAPATSNHRYCPRTAHPKLAETESPKKRAMRLIAVARHMITFGVDQIRRLLTAIKISLLKFLVNKRVQCTGEGRIAT